VERVIDLRRGDGPPMASGEGTGLLGERDGTKGEKLVL
jgi:hypothetical protein